MIALDAIHRDRHTEDITGVTFKITGEDVNRDNAEIHAELRQRIQDMRVTGTDIPELPEYSGWIQPSYREGQGSIDYLLMSYTVEGF